MPAIYYIHFLFVKYILYICFFYIKFPFNMFAKPNFDYTIFVSYPDLKNKAYLLVLYYLSYVVSLFIDY